MFETMTFAAGQCDLSGPPQCAMRVFRRSVVSNRRGMTDRRGGSVIATRHPLIAEPVRTQTASPRRVKVETSPPKETVFSSVDFFRRTDVGIFGISSLRLLASRLQDDIVHACKGGCEKQCPTFRTNCQYKPIESTSFQTFNDGDFECRASTSSRTSTRLFVHVCNS